MCMSHCVVFSGDSVLVLWHLVNAMHFECGTLTYHD